MICQSNKILESEFVPSESDVNFVINKTIENYPRVKTLPWQQCDSWDGSFMPTREQIAGQFVYLNLKASPGLPFAELATTKGALIENYAPLVIDTVERRLKVLFHNDSSLLTPVELVQRDHMDPSRLFVKDEPHPIEKLKEERYRLITSASIVDEIIYGLVFRRQNQLEIDLHNEIPSKAGMGLSTDSQVEDVWKYIEPWITDAKSTDVSGWDWNLKQWNFELCLESHFATGNYGECYKRLARNLISCLCASVYATTDGEMYTVNILGIMNSGLPITASWNSKIRAQVAWLAGSTNVATMGDDCVEDGEANALESNYKRMGLRVKGVSSNDGASFSFCSHTFRDGKAVPENPYKAFVNLLHHKDAVNFPMYVNQFAVENRALPELPELISVFWDSIGA